MTHNRVPEESGHETCDLDPLYSRACTYTPAQAHQLSHMPSPMTPSLSFGSSNYSTALPAMAEVAVTAAATTAAQYYPSYFVMPPTSMPDVAGMNGDYGYCDMASQSGFHTPIWDSFSPPDADAMPPVTTAGMWEPATRQAPVYAFAPSSQPSWEQMPSLETAEAYAVLPPTPPAAQLMGDDQRSKTPKSHRRHPGEPKKRAECKDCGRSFSRTADMIRHRTRIHEEGRDKLGFVCDYHPDCTRKDPTFSRKDHLRAHLREVHHEDLPKVGVNVYLSQAERDATKKQQPYSGSSRRGKAAASVSAQEEHLARSSRNNSGHWDRCYGDSPSVLGQESPQFVEDSLSCADNDEEIEQDTKSGQPEMSTVNPTWWRCSRCLVRVSCYPQSPNETWACPNCQNKIEPDRQMARERVVAESPDFYAESLQM